MVYYLKILTITLETYTFMRNHTSIKTINKIPSLPGVYFLKNQKGEIFYIGKSNNLLSRIKTHTSTEAFKGFENIHTIEWIITANEIEALLREREYIQHYKPKLNVGLKDGKQYIYIGITDEEYSRIYTTHQPRIYKTNNLKSNYIGPFTNSKAIILVLRMLRKSFPYYRTTEKQSHKQQKHSSLPCPYCHINLCPGINPNKTSYQQTVSKIRRIMMGKHKKVRTELVKNMNKYASQKKFEEAANKRNQINALDKIFSHHNTTQKWNIKTKRDNQRTSEYLSKLLTTELPINIIEGYDISNIQGSEPVGSMVRFENNKPHKSLYRIFNIRSLQTPNDFLMINETLSRRLNHREWAYPDLILIDGGKGQLNAALQALQEKRLTIPIVSLAKRLEELYIPNKQSPVLLSTMPKDVEYLLRSIRDESHRFAIKQHRKRHRKIFK